MDKPQKLSAQNFGLDAPIVVKWLEIGQDGSPWYMRGTSDYGPWVKVTVEVSGQRRSFFPSAELQSRIEAHQIHVGTVLQITRAGNDDNGNGYHWRVEPVPTTAGAAGPPPAARPATAPPAVPRPSAPAPVQQAPTSRNGRGWTLARLLAANAVAEGEAGLTYTEEAPRAAAAARLLIAMKDALDPAEFDPSEAVRVLSAMRSQPPAQMENPDTGEAQSVDNETPF